MNNEKAILPHKHLGSIDGWRAISIALVLIQHSSVQQGWPQCLTNQGVAAIGGVGVRFFFVISGFLITWLMLKEINKTGKVSLLSFYIRRALRIMPVYLVFIICVGLVAYHGPLSISNQDWIYSLSFTANYGGVSPPLGHLWSLGIEEQFYLIWPFFFAFYCRQNVRRLVPCLLVPIILCPIFRLIGDQIVFSNPVLEVLFSSHSFFTICDGLAFGCLGAVLFVNVGDGFKSFITSRRWQTLVFGCVLVVFPFLFWIIKPLESLQLFQDTLQCGGFALLLLQSIYLPHWLPYRILNIKVVAAIGTISYSLYLWHGLFDISPSLWPANLQPPHGFPNWLIGVVFASLISYFLIEKPCLAQKPRVLALIQSWKKKMN